MAFLALALAWSILFEPINRAVFGVVYAKCFDERLDVIYDDRLRPISEGPEISWARWIWTSVIFVAVTTLAFSFPRVANALMPPAPAKCGIEAPCEISPDIWCKSARKDCETKAKKDCKQGDQTCLDHASDSCKLQYQTCELSRKDHCRSARKDCETEAHRDCKPGTSHANPLLKRRWPSAKLSLKNAKEPLIRVPRISHAN